MMQKSWNDNEIIMKGFGATRVITLEVAMGFDAPSPEHAQIPAGMVHHPGTVVAPVSDKTSPGFVPTNYKLLFSTSSTG
jgi:fumarylacetoacetate (FAA) hydrolase family protein